MASERLKQLWLWPVNLLDGLGLAVQIISLVGLLVVILRTFGAAASISNSLIFASAGLLVLGFIGYAIRRVAKGESILGNRRGSTRKGA